MQQSFTKEFMRSNAGCYVEGGNTSRLDACSFMSKEPVLLVDIINSEISLRDKYWFVCRKLATPDQCRRIAITVAEIVLPIYEKRYPENKAPREAIQAAKAYIAGHISLEKLTKKRNAAAAAAADADADAADAAAAAYAAADATAAADAAATAYADAAAAYAAAAAAYATNYKQQLQDYLLTFVEMEVPNES